MVRNLKALRLSKGLSQQQLADVIGTTQQSINKYENHSTEPDIDTLIRLADYFEITVDELVGHVVTDGPSPLEKTIPTHKESLFLQDLRKLTRDEQESIRLIIKNYLKDK